MAELKYKGSLGGFAAHNSGTIRDCYSLTKVKGQQALKGGFVAENTGTIKTSYSNAPLKGMTGGFFGSNTGNTENGCYFFHTPKTAAKTLEKLSDAVRAQNIAEVTSNEAIAALSFSVGDVFEYRNASNVAAFVDANWTHPCAEPTGEDAMVHYIKTIEDLTMWRDAVNSGDALAQKIHVVLTCDLDLGSKEWVPIGDTRIHAFAGTFDGQGHTIKNIVITDKKRANKGFFAFSKGNIYNLSVDAKIQGGTCVGGLVANNEGGDIRCCSANTALKVKQGVAGGLVGRNTGTIIKCYAAGSCTSMVLLIPSLLPLLLLLVALVVACIVLWTMLGDVITNSSIFAAVPYDQDQVPIDGEEIDPYTGGNFVSFQFEQEIDVDLSTGLCNFEFKNPGDSNHNIVVQLQISDAQAVRMMGSTGRTAEEQAALESDPSYDADSSRVIIAESGAIRPGYQLSDLRLVALDDGSTLPAGNYNAVIYLVYYDIDTGSRAMVETQLPVEIYIS